MANEYLQRTPTSTGNRRVFTWSTWIKRNELGTNQNIFCSTEPALISKLLFDGNNKLVYQNNNPSFELTSTQSFRDVGSWMHILFIANTTASVESERIQIFVNGTRLTSFSSATYPVMNTQLIFNYGIGHWISSESSNLNYFEGEFTDIFFIDGQALTPDVFGFYKDGKGYISAGSTQSTDFRPGQWVPKSPRIIKAEINRRGGFGVNGFYLPMNSSNNFGADFHTTPDTIFRLKEALPQPKAEIDGSGGYTNALRDDPFKQYLVLAIPFVSGGLQSGFGDYSAAIRGSGSAKSITNNNVSIATTASYYGSAASFNGSSSILTIPNNSDFYFNGQFTIECWVNWNGTSTYYQNFIGCNKQSLPFNNNAAFFRVWGTSAPDATIRSRIGIGNPTYDGSGSTYSSVALPTNQLTHVAATRDSNNITRIFMNGVCVGVKNNDTTVYDFSLEGTAIGQGPWDGAQGYYSGFMQDVRVYKGVAKYKGGFDCPKPYTPVGIATWRAVPDTTANNFATWNPVSPGFTSNALFSNGNLTVSETTSNTAQGTGTFGPSSGKWYYEARAANVTSSSHLIGIRAAEWNNSNAQNSLSYRSNGDVYNYNSTVTSQSAYATGDIIGIAFDPTNGKLWFSKNGVWTNGDPSTGSGQNVNYTPSATTAFFAFDNVAGTQTWDANFGQNPTFSGNTTAGTYTDSNGKGLFKYQPPAGFLALCEDNLPTPAISDPGKHFKTVLWTGDGLSRSITGIGFKPDLVWIKSRTNGGYFHNLVDSVRGPSRRLASNSTNAEDDASAGGATPILGSFDYDGFSLPNGNVNVNENGGSYISWCWKAGGPAVANTDGSITSQVSVNQTAGFSIVSWTAVNPDGRNTLGHGLGKTPKFIIAKSRTSGVDHWVCYHNSLGKDKYILLSSTAGEGSSSNYWSSEEPDSAVFGVRDALSSSNNEGDMIAYCWAEIEGYSKFGSYVGNGSDDGPFVYCGFKPAWVMIKNASVSGYWNIWDSSRSSTNPADRAIFPNVADIEAVTNPGVSNYNFDFLSNGFKVRTGSATHINGSGNTIIFAAFAESPFTTANAK